MIVAVQEAPTPPLAWGRMAFVGVVGTLYGSPPLAWGAECIVSVFARRSFPSCGFYAITLRAICDLPGGVSTLTSCVSRGRRLFLLFWSNRHQDRDSP